MFSIIQAFNLKYNLEMEFNWLAAIGLFFVSVALDAVFALYTVAIVKHQPFLASTMSLTTYLLSAIGIVSYVKNKWYLIPLATGAFVGTYLIVKREALKNKKN